MPLASLTWLSSLCVIVALHRLSSSGRWRRILWSISSFAFFATWIEGVPALVAFAALFVSGYLSVYRLRISRSRFSLAVHLILAAAAFVVLKRYAFVSAWLPPGLGGHGLVLVGLSYMLFRQIHLMVDAAQGELRDFDPWSYVVYQTSWLTLLAGPIQRYQDFRTDWTGTRPEPRRLTTQLRLWNRIMFGIIKIAALAPYLWRFHVVDLAVSWNDLDALLSTHPLRIAGSLVTASAYLYVNFSGYCDIVIAAGRLMGHRLPENFDRPWMARNLLDFWNRWHRTLSMWIRDYLFTTTYLAILRRRPSQSGLAGVGAIFMALFLAGIWHGSTMSFLYFGLMHGLGGAIAKSWEMMLMRRLGPVGYARYLENVPARIAASGLTLGYVSCSLILFFHGS